MIEHIQFWGVLLWMIAMLVMAAIAVRAVWLDATRSGGDAKSGHDPKAGCDAGGAADAEKRKADSGG